MNDTAKVGAGGTAIRVLGAEHGAELEQVRQFFRNYAAWLGVDLSYQNFDEEMATLPGRYAAPEGRVIHSGKQIGTAEGKLVDADGKLYAHATTTCLIFNV